MDNPALRIRSAITSGAPYDYATVVRYIHIEPRFGLKLFKWNRDKIYTIITLETLRQFQSIIKQFKIERCLELFAGCGLAASCFSKYIPYAATDNMKFPVRKFYHKVSKISYKTALGRIQPYTLIIAFLPVGENCVEDLISAVKRSNPLWLVVYTDHMDRVKREVQRRHLRIKRLHNTMVVPGNVWNQEYMTPIGNKIQSVYANVIIYKQ